MSVKIHLSPQKILRKRFDTKMRGYDKHQVDSFLDLIIRDYGTLMQTSHRLHDENVDLQNQVSHLAQEKSSRPIVVAKSSKGGTTATASENSQYINILRRLNKLDVYMSEHNMK